MRKGQRRGAYYVIGRTDKLGITQSQSALKLKVTQAAITYGGVLSVKF
jgi:hypothetical protein